MREGIRAFLEGLGERFEGDDLDATPDRVARAWAEDLVGGYRGDPVRELTWTPAPEESGLVLVRDVRFASVCVHHLLPFTGTAQIAYLPGKRLAGLSKLGRVVEMFARDLQVQERLTQQVADWLEEHLAPRGVGVVLEAEHLCMSLRGVQKPGSRTVTSALHGLIRDDPRTRAEFLALSKETS